MILKVSQKINSCGWRKQLIINFEEKTITKGAFLFHSGDIDNVSATQYKQFIEHFKNNGFSVMEG